MNAPCKTFDSNGTYKTGLLLLKGTPECTQLMSQIDKWMEESYQKAVKEANEAIETAMKAGKGAEAAKKRTELSQITKADPPYALDLDKTTGEETGYVEFKFKQNAIIKTRTGKVIPKVINLFDSIGNPLSSDVSIFGGSTIRVNFTPNYSYMPATKKTYVSLQINAVQVIELVSGGFGTTASDFGFESEEGYIYETPIATESGSIESESIPSTDF